MHDGDHLMAKKRNPNDATMRNVRAAEKRIAKLEAQVKVLTRGYKLLNKANSNLWKKVCG
jgi:hypothetical protein